MTAGRGIVLVGEVVVDVTLMQQGTEDKLRLGGVFHAARALWAIGADYKIAYFAPSYLDALTIEHAARHGSTVTTKIGEITGTPNVMLIREATEAGNQGYEHLLRDEYKTTFDSHRLQLLSETADDVVVLSGNYPMTEVLEALSKSKARIHTDLGNGPSVVTDLAALHRPLQTVFLSTSSFTFPALAKDLPASIMRTFGPLAQTVILKENRGGSRRFCAGGVDAIGAQRREIVHSVGVGDAFDSAYVALARVYGGSVAMHYASWIAADYAETTFPDNFKRSCQRTLKLAPDSIVELPSVSLPWEERPAHQIYVAAPDFDYLNRAQIDRLAACLQYHNFSPRLPVRENGQANSSMNQAQRMALYADDIALLRKCSLLIAVLMNDDPGTQIEIGLAHGFGIPVIVFDPFDRAENIMLTQLPHLVSASLDRVITATFDLLAAKRSAK